MRLLWRDIEAASGNQKKEINMLPVSYRASGAYYALFHKSRWSGIRTREFLEFDLRGSGQGGNSRSWERLGSLTQPR